MNLKTQNGFTYRFFLVSFEDWIFVNNSKIPIMEDFNSDGFYDDIAMVKLRVPIEFTSTVRPICLPSPDQTAEVFFISCFDFTKSRKLHIC